LFLIVFAPLVAALYLAAVPPDGRRRFLPSVAAACWAAAGALVLTIALMGINRGTGGAWSFFMPQIEQAIKLTQPDYDHWWRGDVSQWLPAARYLVIPLAILVAGLAVPFRGHDRNSRLSLTLVALAWAAFGIMCYFQFLGRETTFDYSYMAFVLYPHAFACLGAVLCEARQSARPTLWVAGLGSAAILATLLFLLPAPLPEAIDAISRSLGLTRFAAIVPPLVTSLIGVLAMQLTRGSGRVLVFALWFSVVNAWVAPSPYAYGLGTPSYQPSMLRIFREADRFTTGLDPTLIGIKYWMSEEPLSTGSGEIRLQPVFDSFVATRAWFTNLLGRQSPSPPIEKLTLADIDRGACIGIVSTLQSQPRLQREMEAHFASLGRPLGLVTVHRFEDDNVSLALAVLKPLSSASQGRPPCVR
jgi:hypothetical protein